MCGSEPEGTFLAFALPFFDLAQITPPCNVMQDTKYVDCTRHTSGVPTLILPKPMPF